MRVLGNEKYRKCLSEFVGKTVDSHVENEVFKKITTLPIFVGTE